jgi:hypothetical protein
MGFQGANTSIMEYLYYTKLISKKGKSGHSASFEASIFWKFMAQELF